MIRVTGAANSSITLDRMTPQKMISVVIADDHTLVRRGLVSLLSLNDDIEVVAEVGDGRVAVEIALEKRPDVVMMDLSMPNLSGFEAIRQIKRRAPTVKILVLSAYDNEEYVLETVLNGADGYMLKNTSPDELNNAIKTVASGGTYYSASVAKIAEEAKSALSSSLDVPAARIAYRLTEREREILQLIAEARTHQQIAEILHISVRTVDTHRHNIIQKLGLHDTASLVTYAIKNGIVILHR